MPIQHGVCPLDYFDKSLTVEVYNKVYRIAEPRGGEFDFDKPGKLVGNWFLEGTNGWSGSEGYKNYLAFAYDALDPRYLSIDLGVNTFYAGGVLTRVRSGPDFKYVDVASGEVIYKLQCIQEGIERLHEIEPNRWFLPEPNINYTLLVKMINDEKIQIEVFDGDVSNPSFTSNSKYYTR